MADPYAGIGAAGPTPTLAAGDTKSDPYAGIGAEPPDLSSRFASGANSSLAGTLDLPGQLLNKLMGLLGFGQPFKPIFSQGARDVGLINNAPPPTSLAGQMAESAGRFAGAGLPIAAGARAVGTALEGAEGLAGVAGKVATQLGDQNPIAATSYNAEAGAGSKLGQVGGGTIGQELGGDEGRKIGETIGEFGGAAIPGGLAPITPVTAAQSFAPKIIDRLGGRLRLLSTPKGQEQFGEQVTGNILRPAFENPANVTALENTQKAVDTIPGFKPSLGQRTGSKSLLNEEKDLYNTSTGSRLESFDARAKANTQAIERYHEAMTPEGGPLTTVVDAATGAVKATSMNFDDQAARLANETPRADMYKVGTILRQRLQSLKDQVSQSFDKQFSALKLDTRNIAPEFSTYAQDTLAEVARSGPFARELPRSLQEMQTVAKRGDAVTFSDMKTLRENMNQDIMDAISGTTPNRVAARQLVVAKKGLDNLIQNLPFGPEYQDLVGRYFNDYVKRFETGTAFKVLQKTGQAIYQTADEKVAGLFTDGTASRAMAYKSAFGNDQFAMKAYKAALLDDFNAKVVKDGAISPVPAQKWMTDHAGMFRVFPEMQMQPGDLLQRQLEINTMRTAHEDMALHRSMAGLSTGMTSPEKFIDNALKNPKLAAQLKASIAGNPEARDALRRHLFEYAPEDKTLDDYLANPLVKSTLSSDHIAALRTIFDAKNMVARAPTVNGRAQSLGPLTALEEKTGLTTGGTISRLYALGRGVISKEWILTTGAAQVFNRMGLVHGRDLLEKALWDQDLAKDLATTVRSTVRNPKADPLIKVRPWLVYYGLEEAQGNEPAGPNLYPGGRWQ